MSQPVLGPTSGLPKDPALGSKSRQFCNVGVHRSGSRDVGVTSTITLAFVLSANAQYSSGYYHRRRVTGGGIAGIVIGSIGILHFLCIFCCLCLRRRASRGAGTPVGGRRNRFGRNNVGTTEAGYGAGPQAAWNNNTQAGAGYGGGGYQPPAGPPPYDQRNTIGQGAPQPGFVPPPGLPLAARTKR
ncbi:hypothetical protein A0H81_06193 [Grifola frondosa]|uniref:Uncharacterized protein n=1 Tax=Grifola frondosa TaxID=5627 RepID=A0A1C7MBM0_GRIFR|nr:hypothetical protein A0H81_06193 [Grifola frondosa]